MHCVTLLTLLLKKYKIFYLLKGHKGEVIKSTDNCYHQK